ncbi:prepilin-type N-terminal cleavage/methylation domain-containing protein [Bacillus solimangrovi]|uniref:Prepilin-type N-terminal cleavage/methylation domain-containing protein n=1 Tax=Bacillus solimangrovi TaxID=1305675 RepID=A0A1E5LBI2_9BACI|nr:prepilin-type N-terminal cleavage/methylation domain-containing protein [Bacillus solimangrovi]OEH91448.1 hypothetical protein BFG57_04860 [Bacillus solimangrovi]
MKRILSQNKGFTLVEVLVAILLLTIILTSTMAFFNQAYSYTKQNQNKTVAINVARSVNFFMERQNINELSKKSIQYVGVENSGGYTLIDSTITPSRMITINNIPYNVIVDVGDDTDPNDGVLVIPYTITVQINGNTITSLDGRVVDEEIRR